MRLFLRSGVKLGQHNVRYRIKSTRDWTKTRGYFPVWQVLMWIGYDGRWDASATRFVYEEDRRKAKRRMHRSLRNLRKDTAYY